MNLKLIALSFALGMTTIANAAADKVVGYFPYWSQYSQFAPKDIRYNMVTHIHYVSLSPASDGSLAFADENDVENFKELAKLSSENNVKLIVSVGGMEQEATLAEIAASDELRSTFVSNVSSWLAENNAAGLELDWQNLTTENAENFAKMVAALKEGLGDKIVSVTAYLPAVEAYSAEALNQADYVTVLFRIR